MENKALKAYKKILLCIRILKWFFFFHFLRQVLDRLPRLFCICGPGRPMARLVEITSMSSHVQLKQVWCVWFADCVYDIHTWVPVHMAAGFRLQMSPSVALHLISFSPYFLGQGHSLNMEFTFSAHWLANELQESILWARWLQTYAIMS